jgi:serine/threonine protein kinase
MLSPNTVLQNRYRIVRQLGRGGMGAVYEAIDQRLSRTVALKETLVDSDELRRAFEHEARLLANLRHPALPKVIDHFTEGDGQFLVMEFIPGDDLAQQLEKRGRPFDAPDVMRWTDELLDVLDYLHTHDPPIVHRDIKPHNLKQTAQGRIVLLDFGLAKGAAGEMTRVASGVSILGYTPHYASLEQIQGEKTNARSDLYSMAATLYNLLTNRVPTDALKRATELINDEADPLPRITSLNPNVPEALNGVLTRALALRPSDRPASASAMRATLHNPSLVSDNHDEVTRLRPPDFVSAKGSPVTRHDGLRDGRSGPNAFDNHAVHDPEVNQGNRRKVWIISGIVSLVVVLAGLGAYLALRPHDLTSTVAPTNVPAEGIPSPFNSETPSLGALTIQDADGKILRQGTGVFVRPDEVATSLSVIEGGARGRVALVGQSGSFEIGNVTGFDPVHHLVTLKVIGAKAPPLPASANQRTTIGDKVASLGTAAKYKEASFFEASFAQGNITGYRDDDQMEVKLNGGLSPGAPLLNERGELIGILSGVSGGNANQALAIPVVYVAQALAKRVSGMSLAVAAAKDPFFDFRDSAPEIKGPTKALESKVIQTVRDIHNKAKVPAPPKNDNTAVPPPVQEPTPVEAPDEMAHAEVTGMVEGAFTAPGAKQQAFLIDTKSGSSADNNGPKYLVIFNGDNYVTDLPVKDHSVILKTFDLNRDGINELLLGYTYMQMGVMMDWAELVDINKGKIRVIRDFGTVYQDNCGADEKSGIMSASAIFAGAAATGQFPDFRINNFDAPCGTQGKDSPNWKYVSTGKMQQKY